MKKFLVTIGLFLVANTAFCQQEENGIIYIKHPNIDAVHKTVKAYLGKDMAAMKMLYSDTARWWASGMPKSIPIAEAMKLWMTDFEVYDSVDQKQVGYPDYLHYKDADSKTVQSWWTMSGKSKKTGEVVRVPMFVLDDFNEDGKIIRESIYGDFSKWNAANSGNEEQAVRQVISDLQKALQTGNAAELDRIYADSYTFTGVDGAMSTKAQRLAAIKSGKLKYKSLTIENVKIRMYGDAAVATFNGEARFAPGNENLDGKFMTTGTFIKSNGRWAQVASGNARISK
ncbi:MAG: nuclear transport factor 2 family protein [Chitinophagaceae bacterium]